MIESDLQQARQTLAAADRVLIGAGAGMGVDSGLPDFRGDDGFWRAYPAFRDTGLSFQDLADPRWFHSDTSRAWGFYGHRLVLYRETKPHLGFTQLLEFLKAEDKDFFVFTSNVDGQFQKAGYPTNRLVECHGSIHHLQCLADCENQIWENDTAFEIDDQIRAVGDLPHCPKCGLIARPNILMFGDSGWNASRTMLQEQRFATWIQWKKTPIVAIEFGAGTAIPSVRMECQRLAETVIRVNPRESHGPAGTIPLPLGAKEAIQRLVG